MSSPSVLVAGAGAFGSAIAIELARAGMRVTIADRAALGDNASGVAAGMLAPAFEALFDDHPEHFARLMPARNLWPAFAAELGVEIERAAAVAVSADEGRVELWRQRLEGLGVRSRQVSAAELGADRLALGLFGVAQDEDWRIDARAALAAMRVRATRLGVETRPVAVIGFEPGHARLSDGDALSADTLVIATGASPSLRGVAPELAALTPIKGHILQIAGVETASRRVVRFDGGYVCPAPGGVFVGATMEAGRADPAIDPKRVAELVAMGRRYVPALDRGAITARTGVRGSTADGWPLIGRSEAEGVWLAVGARRNGWLLAPMVARSIAREIAGS